MDDNINSLDILKKSEDVIYNIDKNYSFRGLTSAENKISLLSVDSLKGETNLYIVVFKAATTNVNLVEFITLQNSMYIAPSETYLVFFRIYNPTDYIIKGISIYFISPNTVSVYVLKIQCFCFDELLLYGFESVDLPILFYISSEIISLNLKIIAYVQIHITYLFILNNF
ncbi:MAG: cytochrome c oxidase assembly protein [Clostridium sp.]|nr:cytochrome c oxidase assembly protein [Clostridium sp.]